MNFLISNSFLCPDDQPSKKGAADYDKRLGPAGLALHYANIIVQIDTLVSTNVALLHLVWLVLCILLIISHVCFDGYRSLVQAL